MPALVPSYEQGTPGKRPRSAALTQMLADKGVVVVTWIWQAGGGPAAANPSRPTTRRA